MPKSEEISMMVSRGVMCEKFPFFHSPTVVRKGTLLLRISILITGRFILGGLFEFFLPFLVKKMKKFPAEFKLF